ncbi:hypothetical protein E2Y46_25805 [Salmonella enterica]|nr:hypothetical protein [Salmonella enterica]EAT7955799.1 hypothetical protein [Salmonella enterica]
MINKIDFKAKNLTSNAGLFLLLENAKSNGIFDFIENDLVFDNDSTNKIKMNHIKTMLCGHFIGIDKLERLKLLQNDPLVNEFDGRETTELYTKLVKWEKDRRFVVSRVLKPEKERAQLSLLEGSEYDYFFFVTNTTLLSEKVVIYYEKRGNAENYIKEAKYDMAVGHLLLKSFWANEAVFQMMMLSYNLFLLFKFDSLDSSEYRQQIKTFRLKYVFLAAKIIKTARYVIMKLSENYPYKGVYEKCLV